MNESIFSAGIDIGTSTTQLIFSQLVIQNVSGFGAIPKIEIIDKEIIYRSGIYFTPLISENEINAEEVKKIIINEYTNAGMKPEDISTGAIIITGETSRKRNAKEVVYALSEIAGDFVVATAGPNLEAVLAGKGSGAAQLSLETGKLVANIDIGGGTTNICYFQNGLVVDTACLDIGGRLIKISNDGKITYISEKLQQLLENIDIPLSLGESITEDMSALENISGNENVSGVENISDVENTSSIGKLYLIAECMVRLLEQSILLIPKTSLLDFIKTNQLISVNRVPDIITISGGVADCVKNKNENTFAYGDIGVILGKVIRNSSCIMERLYENVNETMNATVVGAGNYSMEVSGSTIEYRNCTFPIKNIPVVYIEMTQENLPDLHKRIKKAMELYQEEDKSNVQIALAFNGIKCPTFIQIEKMADEIIKGMKEELKKDQIVILVLQEDIAKALGQAVKRDLPRNKALLCIDHISCNTGDYIDIGVPIASGKVVPVVVKTLVFNG